MAYEYIVEKLECSWNDADDKLCDLLETITKEYGGYEPWIINGPVFAQGAHFIVVSRRLLKVDE